MNMNHGEDFLLFYCGIYIAKRNHEASVIDAEGNPLLNNCGDCKRRIIALLDQIFPEHTNLLSDTFGTTSKELLLNYPTPMTCYQSLKARGKHHLTAVGAVARKMCNIIFTLLRENRSYEAILPKKESPL